jgi:hypothetical protein
MVDKLLTAPLGQLPLGLLDFFAVKSMGEYPQRLGDHVLPVMDLTRWYADQVADTGIATIAPVGPLGASTGQITSADWTSSAGAFDFARGGGATIVPQNELWIVLEAVSQILIGDAAGVGDVSLWARRGAGDPTSVIITDGVFQGWNTGAAGMTRAGARALTRGPVFLTPGMEIVSRLFGQNPGAGTINFQHSVRIRRLIR